MITLFVILDLILIFYCLYNISTLKDTFQSYIGLLPYETVPYIFILIISCTMLVIMLTNIH